MNKKLFLLVILIAMLTVNNVFSQQKEVPGNVQEPFFWIKSKNNGDSYYWDNVTKKDATVSARKQKGTAFNFNPSIIFDATQDSLILPLGIDSKKRQTFFLVYKVNDSLKEQFLWTINDPQKTVAIATNKRLADLKKYYYQSYKDKIKLQKANIHFFQQNITDSIAKATTLTIGTKSKFQNLPPEEFTGNISEILVYNRVLSGVETQKVASYLAIKYGISLSQFEIKNYLNSLGQTIWDIDKHEGFTSSITGVGRDDASGLLQSKSSNMVEEGLLTFELQSKAKKLPNNYFTFWSDNGKNLLLKKQEQGEPIGIAREWQLDFSKTADVSLEWTFNPNFIKGTAPQDTYYWLKVDYSGKGTYEENESEYVRLASTASKEKLVLKDFDWDKQKTGTAKFTLKIAPQMFSRVWITQADCGVKDSGKLNYSIQGGEAPFTITVKKEGSDAVLKQWNQDSKSKVEVTLSSGNYDYIIRDAKGNLYSETVFVADKEGTATKLKSNYLLTDGNPIILDASEGLESGNYEYQWYYDGNFIDNSPKILVDQAGDYELRLLNNQGCNTTKKIVVDSDGKEAIGANVVILYPNPSPDGNFTIAIQFEQKTNAIITVYTLNGSVMQQKDLTQVENYIYDGTIKGAAGMYLVSVKSTYGTKTFKVIVK
ncbi:T9SS type A sorting domain-containing protein [Flavobacterium sp. PL002]|uniref:T9SS type A sorting domain-containing protein n=1 Tax=Flavobacterium sp. PL002 TaxID=1897058 RepID=UPI0017885E76|nr:T9SS type A sorting domain-containing protein [Flavobacterium sp. PL002]MBE0392705.1 hypothetical protein [Flavobacterium sp. PL002]